MRATTELHLIFKCIPLAGLKRQNLTTDYRAFSKIDPNFFFKVQSWWEQLQNYTHNYTLSDKNYKSPPARTESFQHSKTQYKFWIYFHIISSFTTCFRTAYIKNTTAALGDFPLLNNPPNYQPYPQYTLTSSDIGTPAVAREHHSCEHRSVTGFHNINNK